MASFVWIIRDTFCMRIQLFLRLAADDFLAEDARRRGVRGADGFAVPAQTFGVRLLELRFIEECCFCKRVGEGGLGDFVVVVDEARGVFDGEGVVGFAGELVRVPCEVDVEGGDEELGFVGLHEVHESGILCDKAGGRGGNGRGVEPVEVGHFGDEGALADDGTNEVEGEGGGIVPVARHHFADCDAGGRGSVFGVLAGCALDDGFHDCGGRHGCLDVRAHCSHAGVPDACRTRHSEHRTHDKVSKFTRRLGVCTTASIAENAVSSEDSAAHRVRSGRVGVCSCDTIDEASFLHELACTKLVMIDL